MEILLLVRKTFLIQYNLIAIFPSPTPARSSSPPTHPNPYPFLFSLIRKKEASK